jgi:hypothetical protein
MKSIIPHVLAFLIMACVGLVALFVVVKVVMYAIHHS